MHVYEKQLVIKCFNFNNVVYLNNCNYAHIYRDFIIAAEMMVTGLSVEHPLPDEKIFKKCFATLVGIIDCMTNIAQRRAVIPFCVNVS